MLITNIIIGLMLLLASILDWKHREVPSVLLTAMILITACPNPENLFIGIIGFITAYLLYDTDFIGGIGDVKAITAIAFMIQSIPYLFAMIVLITAIGLIYKIVVKKIINDKEDEETAFIPLIFIVYLIMWFMGVIR